MHDLVSHMTTTPGMKGNLQRAISSVERWFRCVQSDYVLSAARVLYLVGAAGSLLVAVGGLVFVLFFQTQVWQSPAQEPVPDIKVPGHEPLDLNSVSARLSPPTNIAVHTQPLTGPLKSDTVVGYFTANTANGLVAYPEDIAILGGEDAALFTRIGFRLNKHDKRRTGLIPAPALIEKINGQLSTLTAPLTYKYQLRVAARDVYGNVSIPTNVTFALTYGSASPAKVESQMKLTDYQSVARDIALIVDPSRTPTYFKAYKRALRVPGECGTTDKDTSFASDARRVLNSLKSKLTVTNVEAFYAGLCSAWRTARNDEKAARASAEEARRAVIARNVQARAQAEVAAVGARLGRSTTLSVVGSALVTFLVISLLLAFLAIENHSKAVREAVEVIAAKKKNSAGDADSVEDDA